MVTLLVNLYGSKEAFLTEYQNMLAEKLVGGKPYNLDEETKNLELLKLRFGESLLQNCNIIVKDVRESRRINNNVHTTSQGSKTLMNRSFIPFEKLNTTFISKGYWPIDYSTETLKPPKLLQETFDEYAKKYSEIKDLRKVVWHHTIGYVDITISFDNGDFNFKCLPAHTIVLSYFDERCKNSLLLPDLKLNGY